MKNSTPQQNGITGQAANAAVTEGLRGVRLQRKCACGHHTFGGASCAACEEKRGMLRRKRSGDAEASLDAIPASVNETLQAPGSPLDSSTRAFFESRFG